MKTAPHPADLKVGTNIRTIRMSRGVSQERLAEKLGVTFQQVQKYEKGVNRVSASRLTQICSALDCNLAQIFEGIEATGGSVASAPAVSPAAMRVALLFDSIADANQRAAVQSLLRSMTAKEAPNA
ncbi:helix-turn-helix domain-containing protein [Rhizobium sp. SSA_523]|uniref:helix-turn-helix domain-containing protein n=1 Tax=Rhizobium sp. SSA_523 TaxID=2952477 RepID=UPI0020918529|nr:helix-turn-helix transcriptional regulator [Rhizobium sp. SSA_523]MCO5730120.1 helix-turn-helix domain-containing protein [Rhizobium sp. SSA_523]WKC25185.1 helix-turn-helix transcriptional regulator [Rhizobium sp. SSA_523]